MLQLPAEWRRALRDHGDQDAILDMYQNADVSIWRFPPYCYGMPSRLKALLGRTIPLVKMTTVKQPEGTVRHEALVDDSRIHTVVICDCGFPHQEGYFDGFRQMCKTCLGSPEIICVPETPMLNVAAEAIVADPLPKRFEDAGAKYAANQHLLAETVAALETPMISAEEYIRNVNEV